MSAILAERTFVQLTWIKADEGDPETVGGRGQEGGIATIVLCGISTDIGVESTARCAYEFGYEQVFAEDAMTAMSAEEHQMTIAKIFPRMGRVRKTAEILAAL